MRTENQRTRLPDQAALGGTVAPVRIEWTAVGPGIGSGDRRNRAGPGDLAPVHRRRVERRHGPSGSDSNRIGHGPVPNLSGSLLPPIDQHGGSCPRSPAACDPIAGLHRRGRSGLPPGRRCCPPADRKTRAGIEKVTTPSMTAAGEATPAAHAIERQQPIERRRGWHRTGTPPPAFRCADPPPGRP